ncbi:MAG: iron ABC transporter permease [Chloroflexi bacterium]|nr:iron ABC transporter permease [Chloroflexota bacterium]
MQFPIVILVYLTVLPILFLVYGAFVQDIGSFDLTLANVTRVFGDATLLPLVGRTFIFALSGAFLALLLGGTAAWITERTATRLKSLVSALNLISLTMPSLFTCVVWISLLAPKSGLINSWLASLFQLPVGPLSIYSLPGMIWVEALIGAPFAYLLMAAVLSSMDRSLEEASTMSGASVWTTLRRVTLPIMLPAVLSVMIFRIVRSLESFETPVLIGVPQGIDLMVSKIFTIVTVERSYGVASAYSLALMAASFVGIYYYSRITSQTYRFASVTGKGFKGDTIKLGRYQFLADSYLILFIVILGLLPLVTLVWNALLPYSMRPSGEALAQLTTKNFQTVISSPKVFSAFQNSFAVAAGTAAVCVSLASIVAWIVLRTKMRGRWLLDLLAFLPMTIPGVIMGVGLVWIYLTLPIPVYGTLWIILIGYATSFLPIAMRFMSPALGQIHKELEESAYMSGATWWAAFRGILIPLLLPAALGAAIYIFMLVFRVVSMAIVVYTPSTVVVPVMIFQMWGESAGNAVHALLLINTLVLVPFALSYHWLTRRYGLRARTD